MTQAISMTKEAQQFGVTLGRETIFWRLYIAMFLAVPLPDDPVPEYYTEDRRAERVELHTVQEEWFKRGTNEQANRMILMMSITRISDAFLYYISRVLTSVYRAHPEVLKSEHQVTVREVMEAGDIAEFARRYADTVVDRQSSLGFSKLIAELNRMLNLKFDIQTPEFAGVCEFIEVRNIIAHNEGRVSKLFLQRTGRTDLAIDQPYPLEPILLSGVDNVVTFVTQFDTTLVRKFNI